MNKIHGGPYNQLISTEITPLIGGEKDPVKLIYKFEFVGASCIRLFFVFFVRHPSIHISTWSSEIQACRHRQGLWEFWDVEGSDLHIEIIEH